MSKELKQLMTRQLAGEYAELRDCLVVDYSRVSASEASQLRGELRRQGARMRVVKNRLAQRAFKEVGLDELAAQLDGPCALISGGDLGALCKLVARWSREHEKLSVRGGLLEHKRLTPQQAASVAQLPPLEVLHARIAGAVQSPIAGIACAVRAIGDRLAAALDAIRREKEKAS